MTGSPLVDAGWRRGNLGHLLFVATGLSTGPILRAAHDEGFRSLTEAQLALFDGMDGEGAGLTQLATRAGVAKQSMIELVDRAVRDGLVERAPGAADRRTKLLCLTPAGERLRTLLRQRSVAAAHGVAAAIGAERAVAMRRALTLYLDSPRCPAAIDRLLAQAARAFVRDVLAAVHRHGHREVTEALLSLFRHLDLDGTRLTDIAVRARVTKQSMGGLVARAVRLGLVERAPDRADRRASLIRFTAAGLAMLDVFRVAIAAAERRIEERAGVPLAVLKTDLCRLLADGQSPDGPIRPTLPSVGGSANSPGWNPPNRR